MQAWRFILLEDAFFFLNRAKAFSDTPTAQPAKKRYIRCSVMLSWQALETAAKDVLSNHAVPPFPHKLSEKLKLALKLRNHSSAFDANSYRQHYKLRNDVVHVNLGSPDPTLNDAERMFTFCKYICSQLIPDKDEVEIRIEPL